MPTLFIASLYNVSFIFEKDIQGEEKLKGKNRDSEEGFERI